MININKVNVFIISIFIIIFVGYLFLEKKIKKVEKVENFQSQGNVGGNIDKDIREIIKNIMKTNTIHKNICEEEKKIFDLISNKNFIFINIVKNNKFKPLLTKIQSSYEKNIKFLNRAINLCNKHKNTEYFKKMKSLFVANKDTYEIYVNYFDSNYTFSNTVSDEQNTIILENKIKLADRIIQNHDNFNFQINNGTGVAHTFNVNEKTKENYNFFLETEKIKNDQYKNIIENSGLFTFLNNLRTVDINKDNVKIYRNLMNTKKNLLTNISKISSNQNAEFENFSQNKENEVTTPEEIRYLQTSNNNTNTLINFCKKMKKLDSPSDGGLMFKRFNKEFKKKKEIQIDKLQKEIDNIINSMTQKEVDEFNLYMARTNDQASKQLKAIKIAKDNLDNAKKIKVNIS